MRSIRLANDVVSLGELRVHAARILRSLTDSRRPVVITRHGKPAGVLISPEDFDLMAEHLHFVDAVREGLEDVAAGRLVDDAELDAELESAFSPKNKK